MTAPAAPAAAPKGRLGNGQLRRQVAEYLADHPGPCKTGEIAKALDRSAGAVGNALTTLADRGEADLVPGKPIRYQANCRHRRRSRRHRAQGPPSAQAGPRPRAGRPRRAGRGTLARPQAGLYPQAGCGRPGHPPERAGLPAEVAGRHARCRGPAQAARSRGAGPAVRAARYREDLADRGRLPRDLITVAGDGDTTAADLVGEYTQKPDGTFEFIYGPLIRAMQEGRVLFIDDATLISPAVLAVAYPAMDGRREITVKAHKGEIITAADGFYVYAGHNPGVHGAILTEALSSRFSVQVRVSTDYDLAHALKIDSRAIKAARDLAARQASGEIGWAPQLRELLAYAKVAAILGENAAIANLAGIAPEEDRDAVAEAVAKAFGRKPPAPLALGRQL